MMALERGQHELPRAPGVGEAVKADERRAVPPRCEGVNVDGPETLPAGGAAPARAGDQARQQSALGIVVAHGEQPRELALDGRARAIAHDAQGALVVGAPGEIVRGDRLTEGEVEPLGRGTGVGPIPRAIGGSSSPRPPSRSTRDRTGAAIGWPASRRMSYVSSAPTAPKGTIGQPCSIAIRANPRRCFQTSR